MLSLKALKAAKIKLDLVADSAEILGKTVALNHTSSSHYCVPIDKNEIPVNDVFAVELSSLSEKERSHAFVKLHQQFAHPPIQKLINLLKDAKVWRDEYQKSLEMLYNRCELCKTYKKTPPRPAASLPMANKFNDCVAMDLMHWGQRWILHLIMWSRLTISKFVNRKKPSTIIDNIMIHWVGAGFGVMQAVLTDNDGEFSCDEMREVGSILNVEVRTTAAESPFQNGLCERVHSVTDMMFLKLQEQCPKTPIEVLLAWENNARNSLQMWHGFRSYQLVYGRNPHLPNVMMNQLPVLDASTSSEILATHLNALHAARESFIQSESSERIRRALRCKIRASEEKYEHGEWVYYQIEGQEKWLGPGKVVFQDGKVVFVRHVGVFV